MVDLKSPQTMDLSVIQSVAFYIKNNDNNKIIIAENVNKMHAKLYNFL